MRLLFALPGFHRYDRGAETALIALASGLARTGFDVELIGSGPPRPGTLYRYRRAPSVRREQFERFPSFPLFRNETAYEEFTFALGLARLYRPGDYDATLTCAYPFTNWVLRRPAAGRHPLHLFVTQNGDWPAVSDRSEYRFFGCDGLVCTNPDFFERNRARWTCTLIPNGVDLARFRPAPSMRSRFGLPERAFLVLMVSALIESKRVVDGIHAVAKLPGAHLVVAGDGPLRDEAGRIAAKLLPGRFTRLTLSSDDMPALYNSADAFLHMSKAEAFGNVYVEALACGLPIVGHDSPRLRWIVGEVGRLIDTEDLDAVAAALAGAREDATGSHARTRQAERFAWSTIAVQYADFLRELSARHAARA